MKPQHQRQRLLATHAFQTIYSNAAKLLVTVVGQ
jgi:hypothetical protein